MPDVQMGMGTVHMVVVGVGGGKEQGGGVAAHRKPHLLEQCPGCSYILTWN